MTKLDRTDRIPMKLIWCKVCHTLCLDMYILMEIEFTVFATRKQ